MITPADSPDVAPSFTDLPADSVAPMPADVTSAPPAMPSAPAPAAPAAPAPSGRPTMFRSILAGALAGMAAGSQSKTFGQGLVAGAAGGIEQEQRRFQNGQTAQRTAAAVDQSHAEAAFQAANTARIIHDLHLMPADRQSMLLDEAIQQGDTLVKAGAILPTGPATDRATAQQQYITALKQNPALTYGIQPVRGDDGGVQFQVVQYPKTLLKQDVVLKGMAPDGSDVTVTSGQPADSVGKYYSAALAKKLDTQAKGIIEDQKQSGRIDLKNTAGAAKPGTVSSSGSDSFGNPTGVDHQGQPMPAKVVESRQKDFNKAYVQPLNRIQKTVDEFDRINANPNQTGAERVTGLLAAVGISGDPLQGKGFRINNDVIKGHEDARNIAQSAVAKLNKVFGNGGPITAQQIRDYTNIATGVVHDSYVSAAREAVRQGLPVDFLPQPMQRGSAPSQVVRQIYLDVAQGDKVRAVKALAASGYAVPAVQ